MNISYIYHLVDIGTGEVRYVGRAVDPERRMYLHLHEDGIIQGKVSAKRAWIDWHINRHGRPPEMRIVDSCKDARRYRNAGKLEQKHISAALKGGNRLLNYEVLKKVKRKKKDMEWWTNFL